MDYRRDVLPPFLAVALSLSLHAGLTQVRVRLPDRAEDLDLTPVTVEYLPTTEAGGTPTGPAPAPETAAQEPAPPEALPLPSPPEEAAPPEREPPPAPPAPEPEVRPAAPVETLETPAAAPVPPEASAPPEPPQPAPAPAPPSDSVASVGRAPAPPAATPPSFQDLLPRTEDLRTYARAESTPDPAGGQAQEVTLTLGDTDARYRGYLEEVQGSIDRSWRWREALLAAGGGGQVLVRFSLSPGGQVEDVGVVESSGNPVLDREAADAVRRAPLPEFPHHWTLQRLNLFAQFGYRLE